MSKVELKVDVEENSLDNSADNELLVVMEDPLYEDTKDNVQLVSPSFLDNNEEENNTPYNFRDLSGAVTYKLVHMTGEKSNNNMASHSPAHVIPNGEFYVITNSDEVFTTTPAQKKAIRRQPLQTKAITTAKKRDDKRRATHNEVERRRRDKINSWITKLAALVPNSGLPDAASKGGILAKACDHITELTEKQKRLEKLEVDNDKLVLEILRLNQELSKLREENTSMRQQLADNCQTPQTYHRPRGQKS
ncbi:PREDICTED: upstream stimulatory factor 2 [Papilio xuthus]|uniref:Upstream stimulatory factor 2 n=1 Tax=Papilio xuthus TaxID=66420 RepID=A0A194PIG1_PAPXU|nr:PREDICTED: upstream stimulatory factor 2 [Papilio xuthus]KPI90880.1 Upstream stimulatory factor 2 [Papilio xuthus]